MTAYQSWIESWRSAANGWSTTWFAAFEKLEKEIAGPVGLSLPAALEFARVLRPKAAELEKTLIRVGEPKSAVAPLGYVTAIRAATELVDSRASDLESCTNTCSDEFDEVFRVGAALEDLVLMTSDGARATSDVTRTVPLAEGILTEKDIPGAIPLGDKADLLDYLCTPAYDTRDALAQLPKAQQVARNAFGTQARLLTFHDLRRLTSRTQAWRWFQTLKVRAAGCGLGQHRGARDVGGTWSYELGPTLSVPTVEWTVGYETQRGTLRGRIIGSLVDDTVVLVLVLSVEKSPGEALVLSLLTKEIRKLGVDPKPKGDSP